ncbi:MAG: hypothetical protein BWY08_02179 [Bacteroidetes bacterium ADurb.Bin174]|nr:MAG: hypothetical protein BWY08_02179 [Bacteroidetes bacterium ADurb.Bin174]
MKNHCLLSLLTFFLLNGLLCSHSSLNAENIVISETFSSEAFPLSADGAAAAIIVDNNDADVVKIVVQAFSSDVAMITGARPAVKTVMDSNPSVIVGTLGKSSLIDQLAQNGKINKVRLEGKWETFSISVVDNPLSGMSRALVIAGSDPRGTAFGVFELSRMMGVSPWVWWADVIPESRSAIYVSGSDAFGPPSVKYRGMFINDEDWAMQPWAAKNIDKTINSGRGDIGPRTYEKIFELMLRTKSNYLWPAMHACTKAFWYYKENPAVARKYAIVLGSSHCEPMLRNNEDEWRRNFSSEYPGVTKGEWNWKTNSTVIKNYWIDRVKESKNTEAVYTLGMRAVHDEAMLGYNTDKERAEALKDIIANQRNILETYVEKPKSTIPQLFCPYKEVLLQYNEGIDLPDDVTLLWADDNHGHIRQLSTPQEQLRSGGSGIYYHLSYLGPPRQDYLWLSSTSPVKISREMTKAYDLNAKNIWVFNIGDLKPAEYEYQFAMDLAWDVEAWRPEKAHQYARYWAEENFGSDLADAIAEIQRQYYYLSASGRPDQINWVTFDVDEMEDRLVAYATLVDQVNVLESQIPDRLKAAYFQLIVYPIKGAAAINEKILGGKLSFDYARLGKTSKALAIADRSKEAYRTIRDLTNTYNKVIANGKWDGIMHYAPMSRGFFYDPIVVTPDVIPYDFVPDETPVQKIEIAAKDYQTKSQSVKVIEELGVAGSSVTVLPLNMIQYTASNISSAPSVEYKVRLNKGENKLRLKFLPTFPLYPELDLRYAVSVDGATPRFVSLNTKEGNNDWRSSVLRGYARQDMTITSESAKDIIVKIYFADPGVTLSALELTSAHVDSFTGYIINPDFELGGDGKLITEVNKDTLVRGTPYGWKQQGTLKGNSWGTNQDAVNFHGMNVCWYASTPMPYEFRLYQDITMLPAGEYLLRCQLAVPEGKLTTQRLFANKYVQYYGKESDYASNLTAAEINTFAGYEVESESGGGQMIALKEMAVKFILLEGESLRIGICTSNRAGDGTYRTDNSGFFKVDNFRLERIRELDDQAILSMLGELILEAQNLYDSTTGGTAGGQYPQQARTTLQVSIQTAQTMHQNANATMTQLVKAREDLKKAIIAYKKTMIKFSSFIVNASFEYKSEGVLNDGSTVYGTPYGWQDTENISGTSFGINRDATNMDGSNSCWYRSAPSMPDHFELYQEITGLPSGKYTVRCKMSVPNGKITTQRLFANNQVRYYGYTTDYGANIAEGEEYSFAGLETSSNHRLQEMEVNVVIQAGETLKLGVRTSNKKADGTASTGDEGWFKVDDFRLELKELYEEVGLELIEDASLKVIGERGRCRIIFEEQVDSAYVRIISLSGKVLYSNTTKEQEVCVSLPTGLYIVAAFANEKLKTGKVLVN